MGLSSFPDIKLESPSRTKNMNFFEKKAKGDEKSADIYAEDSITTLYYEAREVRHNPWI